jgi:hypothetical protein
MLLLARLCVLVPRYCNLLVDRNTPYPKAEENPCDPPQDICVITLGPITINYYTLKHIIILFISNFIFCFLYIFLVFFNLENSLIIKHLTEFCNEKTISLVSLNIILVRAGERQQAFWLPRWRDNPPVGDTEISSVYPW